MRTYKYKLQNHNRNKHLHSDLAIIAHVYNHFVALCRRHYRIYGQCAGYKRLTFSRMCKHLTKLKRLDRFAHWRIPFSWAIQNALKRIERGYINFFEKRAKRPPKFRSRKKYRSMTFDGSQVKIAHVADAEHGIRRSPVAKIRINGRWYRFWYSRPTEGKTINSTIVRPNVYFDRVNSFIKQVTVKRDTLGDFYITIVTDAEGLTPEPLTGETAGFDFGLKTFLTCSDETKHESPLFYKRSVSKVAKASRSLSKKKRGSNNREKARKHLARQHRKIQRQREEHHWKLAINLVRKFDFCFFEALNFKGMARLWGKKVLDLAFGDFMLKIRWQAHKRCKRVETINRWTATTTVCHACGQKHAFIDLKVREWHCSCGIKHDRDINAAIKPQGWDINLCRRGHQTRHGGHPFMIAESPFRVGSMSISM